MKRNLNTGLVVTGLILCSSSFAWNLFNGSTDFVKNTLLDQPVSVAKSKYQTSLKPSDCNNEQKKACKDKSWNDCQCFEAPLVFQQARNQTLSLVTHAGNIVETTDAHTALNGDIPYFYPALKTYTGDSAPDEVHEMKSDPMGGFQAYLAIWTSKDLFVGAVVDCPKEKYGGAAKVTSALRDCYTHMFQVTRVRPLIIDSKKVSVKY